jgi:hypothetical protein
MAKKKKNICYAVRIGHRPGIYKNMDDCKAACEGFPGREFKGFHTLQKTRLYMENTSGAEIEPKKDYLQAFLETNVGIKDENLTYYAVARGKQPGVYTNLGKAQEQMDSIEDAEYKEFTDLKDALAYVKENGSISHENEIPIFQSHFDNPQFRGLGFQHQPDASFDDNFNQLAASQGWTSNQNTLREQRAIALKEELRSQYFPTIKEEDGTQVTEEESKLRGYQNLCRSVGKPQHTTIEACFDELKNRPPWVNIKDLIDARRQRVRVQTFMDWHEFVKYTLQPGKRIDYRFAQKHEDLRPFLQFLSKGPPRPALDSARPSPSPPASSPYQLPVPEIKQERTSEPVSTYFPTLLSQYEEDIENLLGQDFEEEYEYNARSSEISNSPKSRSIDSECEEEVQECGVDNRFDDEEQDNLVKIKSEKGSQSNPFMLDCDIDNPTPQPRTHSAGATSNDHCTADIQPLKRKRKLPEKSVVGETPDISATIGQDERPKKKARTRKTPIAITHCKVEDAMPTSFSLQTLSSTITKGLSKALQENPQKLNSGAGVLKKKKKKEKKKHLRSREHGPLSSHQGPTKKCNKKGRAGKG